MADRKDDDTLFYVGLGAVAMAALGGAWWVSQKRQGEFLGAMLSVLAGEGITPEQLAAGKSAFEREILLRGQNALDHVAARYDVRLEKVKDGWRERVYEFHVRGKGGHRVVDDSGRERSTVYHKPAAAMGQTPQMFYDQIPAVAGLAYRGMSWEAWQHAKQTGAVSSTGEGNIGSAQEGLTFYSEDPSTGLSYAGGFAPWFYKPAHGRPGVVIAVPRGTLLSHKDYPQGIPVEELASREPVPVSLVREVWYVVPYEVTDGVIDIVEDKLSGDVRQGSGLSPRSYCVVVPGVR